MKVQSTDGKVYTLEIESEADRAFVDALDAERMAFLMGTVRQPTVYGPKQYQNIMATVIVDRNSEPALRVHAAHQALGALGQLFSLGAAEAAQHGHVGTPAADPQPQHSLTALLKQLQVVTDTLSGLIGQHKGGPQ